MLSLLLYGHRSAHRGDNESRSPDSARGENGKPEPTTLANLTRTGSVGLDHKAAHHDVWSNHPAAGNWLSLDIYYATRFAVWPKSIPFTLEFDTCTHFFLASPTDPARLARPTSIVFLRRSLTHSSCVLEVLQVQKQRQLTNRCSDQGTARPNGKSRSNNRRSRRKWIAQAVGAATAHR